MTGESLDTHPKPVQSILIVDDTPANLNLLCGIIKERGYKARPVPSGELALQAAAACAPDLILLDIDMPDMTGFEVCKRLKADPALKNIPVIFISALTDISTKIAGFAAGGVDYITKPFQIDEVHVRVATHLELQRQRHELQASNHRLRELELHRDNLVHMIIHDLRAPLGSLSMLLGFMKEEPAISEEHLGDIDAAIQATTRMALMVTSVLDINQLEAGQMRLQFTRCDLVALAVEVIESLRSLAKGLDLSIRPQKGNLIASVDRGLVFRVMQNLVANALKFVPTVGGQVVIELEGVGDGIGFRVIDNGLGVPAEHHERIFKKFAHVDSSAPKTFSTGLGLPFCRLAVEAHGGQIGIESEAGRTTFWVLLPEGSSRCVAQHSETQTETSN